MHLWFRDNGNPRTFSKLLETFLYSISFCWSPFMSNKDLNKTAHACYVRSATEANQAMFEVQMY